MMKQTGTLSFPGASINGFWSYALYTTWASHFATALESDNDAEARGSLEEQNGKSFYCQAPHILLQPVSL